MDVDETFSWMVGVTLLLQKVDVMMCQGGWLRCLRIQRQQDWFGLLAEPSKSFDDIDFANASGRAPPALKNILPQIGTAIPRAVKMSLCLPKI